MMFNRRSRSARRGVSILEVLFAIAVTTIGLLGAIAVFPVASAQARKGRISDAMAVAGMSAAHDFDVRGMRKPTNWVAFDFGTGAAVSPVTQYENYLAAEASTPGSGNPQHRWFSGHMAVCIDPRYIANHMDFSTSPPRLKVQGAAAQAARFPGGEASGIPRISLLGGTSTALRAAVAEAIFMFDDDLTFGRPDDLSLNAYQVMDRIGTTDFKRQSDGHMSWMATLVPKLGADSVVVDEYILSVVVFYDRPLDELTDTAQKSTTELTFNIGSGTATAFPGGGITGGDVRLRGGETELNRIKSNDWLLLAATSNGKPVMRWYRVVDVDADAVVSGSEFERHVTLFGQDWDTSLNTNAVWVEGVVGVYEKTIRLDRTL